MSHRGLNLQNEPNVKRQKTNSVFTRRTSNSILNMIGMQCDEHMPLEKTPLPSFSVFKNIPFSSKHNNTTLLTCESDEIRGDSTIGKPLNVCDDVGVFMANFNKSASEAQRSTEESVHLEREVAIVVSDRKHIDELPVEILIYIFDYLSLEDLCSIRQTSKQWKQIAAYCFQHNYSKLQAFCEKKFLRHVSGVKLDAFIQLIGSIYIAKHDNLQYFLDKKPNFRQLKNIELISKDLTGIRIDCMKEVLNEVEQLTMLACEADVDHIVASTPNLKCLNLCYSEIGNEWLHSKYPTVESFIFTTRNTVAITEFLENNPNIRHFGTNSEVLWENRHSMQTLKVTLDVLSVKSDDDKISSQICLLLNELHELGIFKRLKLYIYSVRRGITNNDLASLKGLIRLSAVSSNLLEQPLELKTLGSLQELHVRSTSEIIDIEVAATDLQNLERIHAMYANFERIVLFIKSCTKLREIIIRSFNNANYLRPRDILKIEASDEEPKFINLSRLNRERSKLPNARKITLYVDEKLYLATKWARRETDLEFIMLKPKESVELDVDFFL